MYLLLHTKIRGQKSIIVGRDSKASQKESLAIPITRPSRVKVETKSQKKLKNYSRAKRKNGRRSYRKIQLRLDPVDITTELKQQE